MDNQAMGASRATAASRARPGAPMVGQSAQVPDFLGGGSMAFTGEEGSGGGMTYGDPNDVFGGGYGGGYGGGGYGGGYSGGGYGGRFPRQRFGLAAGKYGGGMPRRGGGGGGGSFPGVQNPGPWSGRDGRGMNPGNAPAGPTGPLGPGEAAQTEFDYWRRGQIGHNADVAGGRATQQIMGLGTGWRPDTGPFAIGGDPAVRSFLQQQAAQTARGMQGQAVNAAALSGADPAMAQWMRTQALMNAGGGAANAMNNYAAQSNLATDDLIKRNYMDYLMNWASLGPEDKRAERGQYWGSKNRNNNGGGWGQMLGAIGGGALGGWLGPGGWFAGKGG